MLFEFFIRYDENEKNFFCKEFLIEKIVINNYLREVGMWGKGIEWVGEV